MKTAVIISGQLRTFAQCLPGLNWYIFRKLENPIFFISTAEDEDASTAENLKLMLPEAAVHIEVVKQPHLDEPPSAFAGHAPYAITPTKTTGIGAIQGILRQQWHMSRAWKFATETLGENINEFDKFIRCRPDLHFHRFTPPAIRTPELPVTSEVAVTPWWGNYGGVNDRFAVLGRKAAEAFFTTYDRIPELLAAGCPFHPESLVGAALERDSIAIHRTLDAEFAFKRKDGSFEHMVCLPQEICAWTAFLANR